MQVAAAIVYQTLGSVSALPLRLRLTAKFADNAVTDCC